MIEISNAEYRAMEGLSSTDIKAMAKSMAHFKYQQENPREDTPSLLFGRAYHKYCLEPDTFFEEFIIAPYVDRRTKEGKAKWQEFLDESKGKDVIDADTFQTICDMRTALYATPFAKKLLYGSHEKSFFWDNEETGLKCKCRPDSFGKLGNEYICVDLKTCSCAETQAFMRDAIKYNYDIQAVHYTEGLKANFGSNFKFIFIAQEKTAPYLVNILEADKYFMQSGRQLRAELLYDYKKCLERDEYPGYMGFGNEAEINTLSVSQRIKDTLYIEESEE